MLRDGERGNMSANNHLEAQETFYDRVLQELREMIPESQYQQVMGQMGCELDYTFLGFIDHYKRIADTVPSTYTIVDLGCYLAAQAWLFKDHEAYIGLTSSPR